MSEYPVAHRITSVQNKKYGEMKDTRDCRYTIYRISTGLPWEGFHYVNDGYHYKDVECTFKELEQMCKKLIEDGITEFSATGYISPTSQKGITVLIHPSSLAWCPSTWMAPVTEE